MNRDECTKDAYAQRNKSNNNHESTPQVEKNNVPGQSSLTDLIRAKLSDESFVERLAEKVMGRRRSISNDIDENVPDSQLEAWVREAQVKLEEVPENPNYWFLYGVAVASLGRRQEAEKAFAKAVALGPRHVKAWYWLGMIRNNMDRDSDALEAHEKATELAPDWASSSSYLML